VTQARPGEPREGVGSVDSQELARWTGVRVIRLVLPAGEGLPPHRAPGRALVVCLRGRIRFTLNGRTRHLGPEDSLAMEAGDDHALQAEEAGALLLVLETRRP
jgi:quercetin dioxygenase-like cupin family protein